MCKQDIKRVDPIQLGQRIRAARERRGLSQEDLAALISRDQRGVSEYERGQRKISVTDLPGFAKALDVSILYFFEGEVEAGDLEHELLELFQNLPDDETKKSVIEMLRLLIGILD